MRNVSDEICRQLQNVFYVQNLCPENCAICEIMWKFDVLRAVHRNIISRVKPTRCTSVSNLFYFGITLYMFRTVFTSIIRSSRLYIQQQAFVKQILLSACCLFASKLASRQQYLFDKCLLLYVQSLTPDDGRKDRPKHVQCHSKIK